MDSDFSLIDWLIDMRLMWMFSFLDARQAQGFLSFFKTLPKVNVYSDCSYSPLPETKIYFAQMVKGFA